MHFTGTKSSPYILPLLSTNMLSSHGGFLAIVMYHHRETIQSNEHSHSKCSDTGNVQNMKTVELAKLFHFFYDNRLFKKNKLRNIYTIGV